MPADLRAELARARLARGARLGRRARRVRLAAFLPHLERNVELRRRYAECFEGFDGFVDPYDPLLDDFEPGMTTPEMSAVLGELRDGIRPLIAADRRARRRASTIPACTATSRSTPRSAGRARCVDGCRCRRVRGGSTRRCTRSPPRSRRPTSASRPGSTRVHRDRALGGDPRGRPRRCTRTGSRRSSGARRSPSPSRSGFHESQSRLWENWVGRGRPYLERLHAAASRALPRAVRRASTPTRSTAPRTRSSRR